MERTKSFPEIELVRKEHRRLRENMTTEEVAEKSQAVCERVLSSDGYQNAHVLYAYYPLGNEVSCLPIVKQALLDGKIVALPRVAAGNRMDFYRITSLEEVSEGSFHVMEPLPSCTLVQDDEAFVLVPGLVFDIEGNRYGYGKGYYDRYFARFPGNYRVALAYEHQMEGTLITLPTDVKMHRIETERTSYPLEPGSR